MPIALALLVVFFDNMPKKKQRRISWLVMKRQLITFRDSIVAVADDDDDE